MLFLSIYSYPPENRAQVIQRRLEKGTMDPPGGKLLGEWSYAGGGKVFRLSETDDVRNILGLASAWADLGQIEIYPVLETDQALKLLRST
jgi:hypothetical protein